MSETAATETKLSAAEKDFAAAKARVLAYARSMLPHKVRLSVGSSGNRYDVTCEQYEAIADAPMRDRHKVTSDIVYRLLRDAHKYTKEDAKYRASMVRSRSYVAASDGYDWHKMPIVTKILYNPTVVMTLEERLRNRWLNTELLPKGLFGIEMEFATEERIEKKKVLTGTGVCDAGPECCPPVADAVEMEVEVPLPAQIYRDIETHVVGLRMKSDGSVSPRASDAQEAALLVGPNGYKRLEKTCKMIRERGGFVNKTCGLHVHLDVRNEDRRVIGIKASKLWDAMPILLDLIPEERKSSTYCKIVKPAFDIDRYAAINLRSVAEHGTIEVRMGAGSLNAGKIWHWANLLAYISKCKTRLKSWEEAMQSDIPLPLRMWAVRRANELRPNEELMKQRFDMIAPGFSDVLQMEYGKEE